VTFGLHHCFPTRHSSNGGIGGYPRHTEMTEVTTTMLPTTTTASCSRSLSVGNIASTSNGGSLQRKEATGGAMNLMVSAYDLRSVQQAEAAQVTSLIKGLHRDETLV